VRILITGAGGQVGSALAHVASNHEVLAADRSILDTNDPVAVERVVSEFAPEAIVNCGAMTDVDGCERDPDLAYTQNALAPRYLALAARAVDAHVVQVSTDYVFDGTLGAAYREWDLTHPLSVYARSKLGGEREVIEHAPSFAIARTAWVFGRPGTDFPSWVVKSAEAGTLKGIVDDQWGSPTYANDLADVLLAMAERRVAGTFHVANEGRATRHDQGVRTLELLGRSTDVPGISAESLNRPAPRPRDVPLDSRTLGAVGLPAMRPWRDALDEYVRTVLSPRLSEVLS